MEKLVRLTENDLHDIVKKSLNKLIESTKRETHCNDKFFNKFVSTLTEEKQKKLCVDYGCVLTHVSYNNPLSIDMQKPIREGLIKTYPADKTLEYIKNHFGLTDDQITKIHGANDIDVIKVAIPVVGDNLNIVKKAFRLCGYYLSSPKEETIEQNKWVALQFEPKIEDDISEKLRKEETV